MSAAEDSRTLGSTRLGFADEKDVDLFVSKLEAFERGELTPDAWRSFRLLNGVYGQRQDEYTMIRVKIPQGITTAAQLHTLADIADRFANGKGHVTTRQNIQYHFVKWADADDALRLAAQAGITTKEACGHSVRNITCCPFAGISKVEPFDPTPYAEALTRHLLRGQFSSSLPRKFKIGVGGCCNADCAQSRINDLGYLATQKDGKPGFVVVAGGGLGTLRRNALTLEEFLPVEEMLEAGEALVRVFHRIGNRENKAKARLKWAIDKLGVEAFLAEYRQERDVIRAEGGRPLTLPVQPTPPALRPPLPQALPVEPGYEEFLVDNVRAQKQDGFSAVVVRLVLGDLTSQQFRILARLSTEYSEGELRFTNEQNLVLRYVPTWRLPALHRELVAAGLAKPGANTILDVTSCPGASSCKLAVTQSRGLATLLTEHLEAHPEVAAKAKRVDIKISGCPNSCGQHHIAAIGFQGGVRKVDGRAVPQYHLHLGGSTDADSAKFGKLSAKIPARLVPKALDRLVDLYDAEKQMDEVPAAFFRRVTPERVKTLLKDLIEVDGAALTEQDYIDLGETKAFVVEQGEGECAA